MPFPPSSLPARLSVSGQKREIFNTILRVLCMKAGKIGMIIEFY